MEVFFNGAGSEFDPVYYKNLTTCFAKYNDTLLMESQDNAWKEMNNYFLSNGTDNDYENRTDHWGQCTDSQTNPRCLVPPYLEKVSGVFGSDKMLVYEPCNYASNIAFYHAATRICDYPDWTVDEA
jgi:hypothetical protein